MDSALKAVQDTDHLLRAGLAIVRQAHVALHARQIETGNGAAVETPARVIPRAKGIVDHEVYTEDAAFTQPAKRSRVQLECLIEDRDLRLLATCNREHIAVELRNLRSDLEPELHFAANTRRIIVIPVKHRDMFQPQSPKRSQAIDAEVIGRETGDKQHAQMPQRLHLHFHQS